MLLDFAILWLKLSIHPSSCHGLVLGEYGNSNVALWSGVNVSAVCLQELNPEMGTDNDSENWRGKHKRWSKVPMKSSN